MVTRLALSFLLLLTAPLRAEDEVITVQPGDLALNVSTEDLAQPPFVDEMVLLTIHGAYKIPISLEKLEQPDLDGFDWTQLGEDNWYETQERGRKVVNFQRIMALFPNRSGTLTIPAFEHRLTLLTRSGERFERIVQSDPVTLEVLPKPDTADPWLPVRGISVADRWSNAPDRLGPGEGALRIVAVTVEGVKPEQLPPMPELQAAGARVFSHPEKRITQLRVQGPVTRAFWRWTVRPENPPAAYLKPLRIAYFDTAAREDKEIVLAAQRIAMTEEAAAALLQAEEDAEGKPAGQAGSSGGTVLHAEAATPLALLGGLVAGLAVLLPGLRRRRRADLRAVLARLRPDLDAWDLRRAASRGDAAAMRVAAARVIRRRGTVGEIARAALSELDRHLFAGGTAPPDLRRIARTILRDERAS